MTEAQRLYASGDRPISNRYRMAARIDRADWREHMARNHVHGFPNQEESLIWAKKWVEGLRDGAADYYRRVLSRDKLENIPQTVFDELRKLTPGSGWGGVNDYREVIPKA